METINLPNDIGIKLQIAISSDAIVATNISLNDVIIRKSEQYKFNVELGVVADLDGKGISIVSSFFISENIDQILQTTQATYKIICSDISHDIVITKQKMTNNFFIIYGYAKLKKI